MNRKLKMWKSKWSRLSYTPVSDVVMHNNKITGPQSLCVCGEGGGRGGGGD